MSQQQQQQQSEQPPPPVYQQPATTVIVNQGPIQVGDSAMSMDCPHCQASIVTRVEHKIGMMVWIVAGVMLLLGLWCGCCLIPFCISALKDVVHTCPNCNRVIGEKKKMG